MFDRLVLSTKDQRKGRTGKFLFATALFYAMTLASALVVSVIAASPVLYEKMDVIKLVPLPPPAAKISNGPRTRTPRSSQPTARANLNNIQDLDTLRRNAATNEPSRSLPNIPTLNLEGPGGSGGPVRVGGPDGVIGGSEIGVPTGGKEIELPPPPPVVQKPVEKPQPPAPTQPLRISSRVLTGTALERRTPLYPPLARQARIAGPVVVEIIVSPEGRVESARALSGHPMLKEAALEAAYGWRFQPTLLNGVAVRVTGLITFNFNLN